MKTENNEHSQKLASTKESQTVMYCVADGTALSIAIVMGIYMSRFRK